MILKISKKQWQEAGKKAGWIKEAQITDQEQTLGELGVVVESEIKLARDELNKGLIRLGDLGKRIQQSDPNVAKKIRNTCSAMIEAWNEMKSVMSNYLPKKTS